MVRIRHIKIAAALIFGLSASGVAWAQRNDSAAEHRSDRYSAQKPVQERQGNDADRAIARILGNINRVQADLAHFAEGRAQTDAVNRFARKQSQQHENDLAELQQFASDAGSGIGRSDESSDDSTSADSGNSSNSSSGFNWQRVSREIANENLKSAKKELRDKSGLDFDWTFVGQQKLIHDALCADLKVFRRYASSSLRDVLDEQRAEVERDQQALDGLMDRLKDEEYRQLGRSESDRNDRRYSQSSRRNQREEATSDSSYIDEFSFAEADFTTKTRLTKDQNGRTSLGVALDRRQRDRASVADVRPDSPAAQAGLQPGDAILAVNGHEINSPDELVQQISRLQPSDTVQLVVDRTDFRAARVPLGGNNDSQGRASRRSSGQQERTYQRGDENQFQ